MRNQVFISYRQESPEHAREVRRLGELLRQAGLPVAPAFPHGIAARLVPIDPNGRARVAPDRHVNPGD